MKISWKTQTIHYSFDHYFFASASQLYCRYLLLQTKAFIIHVNFYLCGAWGQKMILFGTHQYDIRAYSIIWYLLYSSLFWKKVKWLLCPQITCGKAPFCGKGVAYNLVKKALWLSLETPMLVSSLPSLLFIVWLTIDHYSICRPTGHQFCIFHICSVTEKVIQLV